MRRIFYEIKMLNITIAMCFILFVNGIFTKSIENNTVDNKIAALEKLVDKLEGRINKTEISFKEKNDHKTAVFYARLTSTKTLNMYSVIQFDSTIINVGGHYNPTDGVFVAPVSGVYMFVWSTLTYNGNGVYTELRVDGAVKSYLANSAPSNQFSPGSMSLVRHVKEGNHVWVQTGNGSSGNYFYTWNGSASFMGFLIYRD